jgi:two-component system, chemotaxis family, chemotaxis protein CheY
VIPILKSAAKAKPKERKRILAIDDDTSIRALLEILFQRKYEVVSKEDGFEALLWLENGNIPDIIVADIQMPRMNGVDFVNTIKKSGYFRHIPIIMLSGIDDNIIKKQCMESGVSKFYQKPFNPNDLLEYIETIVNENIHELTSNNFRYA